MFKPSSSPIWWPQTCYVEPIFNIFNVPLWFWHFGWAGQPVVSDLLQTSWPGSRDPWVENHKAPFDTKKKTVHMKIGKSTEMMGHFTHLYTGSMQLLGKWLGLTKGIRYLLRIVIRSHSIVG